MMSITYFISIFGWSLLHSVWQILLLGIILKVTFHLFRNSSSGFKVNVSLAGLFSIPILFGITYYTLYQANLQDLILSNPILENSSLVHSSNFQANPQESNTWFENSTRIFPLLSSGLDQYMNHIVVAWFLGFLFFVLRFSGSYLYIFRLKTKFTNPLSEKWQEKVIKLATDLGIRTRIKLVESALVKIPMVVGHFKPLIILPLGLITYTPINQIEAILIHELAHIRRNDFLINLFRTTIETIFFYHPVFWWISRKLEEYRENRCDDLTIDYCGNAESLQKALLDLSLLNQKTQHIAAALYKNENQLLKRIKRMKTTNQLHHGNRIKLRGPIFLIAALLMAIAGSSFIPGQSSSIQGIINPAITIHPDILDPLNDEAPEKVIEPMEQSIQLPDSSLVKSKEGTEKKQNSGGTISLQLDDDGNLLSVSKNGEELQGEEREKYEQYTQQVKEQEQKTLTIQKNEQQLLELQKNLDETSARMYEVQKEYQQVMEDYMVLKGEIRQTTDPDTWSILEDQLLENQVLQDQYFRQKELVGIYSTPSIFDEYNSQLEELQHREDLIQGQFDQSARLIDDITQINELEDLQREELLLKEANTMDLFEDLREMKMEEIQFEMEIREALINDQVIEEGERLTFILSKNRLVVNGKKQNSKLHKKYLNLYTNHSDKALTADTRVIIED